MAELKTREREEDVDQQLPESWSERASEAAKRFNLTVPEDTLSADEVEHRLRQLEQEDGE